MDLITRNTDYALRAVLHIAGQNRKDLASASEIARRQKISYQLTCKLLQKLQKAGIVRSTMGAKGGYRLAKMAEKVSLLDVIEAIQGKISLNKCILPGFKCPLKRNCKLRPRFQQMQETLKESLIETKLSDLVKQEK